MAADPLKLLRDYILNNKFIGQIDNLICFGKIGFLHNSPTNFEIWNRKGEYYTLEALLFFSKNKDLTHPDYVKEVVKIKPKGDSPAKLQVVTRADRKDVIDYLTRERLDKMPASINSSIPAPVPIKLSSEQLKQLEEKQAAESGKRLRYDVDDHGPAKRPRVDDETQPMGESLDQLAAQSLEYLEDEMQQFVIISSRERVWVTRNTMIKIPYTRMLPKLSDYDKLKHLKAVGVDKALTARPRTLQQAILDKLKAIKDKHDANVKAKEKQNEDKRMALRQQNAPSQQTSRGYSRYEQEKVKKDRTDIYGLDMIDQTVSLVTHDQTDSGSGANLAVQSSQKNAKKTTSGDIINANSAKSTSKGPIILIPAGMASTITMTNARFILEELRYLSPSDAAAEYVAKGVARPVDLLIKRPVGPPIKYRVLDNPAKLRDDQWNRVVAVFAQGKAWQFKGYKIPNVKSSDVADIFHEVCGFHIKTEDMKLEQQIAQWNVKVISLSAMKMHDHKHRLKQIWDEIDKFVRMSPRLSNSVVHP